MGWFNDERLDEIYHTGATYGVSPEDCFLIRRKLVILMSVRSEMTLSVIGRHFPMPGGRRALQATPDWSISFAWFEEVGALNMQLEP